MRILGVDYGLKKIGLAMGDAAIRVASPCEIWVHSGDEEEMAGRLSAFAIREDIERIVVGVPRKSDGELTEQGKRHEAFVSHLRSSTGVPVVTVDESFTSKESRRLQDETGTDAPEDALAAMLILEEYFETLA